MNAFIFEKTFTFRFANSPSVIAHTISSSERYNNVDTFINLVDRWTNIMAWFIEREHLYFHMNTLSLLSRIILVLYGARVEILRRSRWPFSISTLGRVSKNFSIRQSCSTSRTFCALSDLDIQNIMVLLTPNARGFSFFPENMISSVSLAGFSCLRSCSLHACLVL